MSAIGEHTRRPAPTNRWRLFAGAAAVAIGLLWLLLTIPSQLCAQCGATPMPATALTPGAIATMDSPVFDYSPGWRVDAFGADPAEPVDAFAEPAGAINFTYSGDALWLLLAPGDYWSYLYATVDGQPANRLANIAGNRDSTGAAAGYTTLLAPELAGQPTEERLRWIEAHRSSAVQEAVSLPGGEHSVRLEFWRGWGQTPLRAVAVDPPPESLLRAGAQRPLWNAPLWPGALFTLAGLWLLGSIVTTSLHVRRLTTIASPHIEWLHVPDLTAQRISWGALTTGAALVAAGTISDRWLLALAGIALLGVAGLLRPTLWVAALLFALPFAYAVDLPLLPGRALGIVDVGVLGGAALLVGHLMWRWLSGVEQPRRAAPLDRWQRVTLILLALLVGWALVASLDVRYPALALREWRVIFSYALIFAATLIGLLRNARHLEADRWMLVAGWLLGATTVAAIGLWGFVSGQGFVSAAEGVRRVQALYDSANNLALYLDRTLAVTLALAVFARGRRQQALWTIPAAVQGLAWLLTFSKGALFLAAPAIVVILGGGGLWLLRRRGESAKWLWVLVGIVVIAILALTPFIGAERFQRLLDFEQGTGFLRLQLWRSSWQMALDHPLLGVGPDQFLYHYRSGYLLPEAWQEPNLNHPHNLLLDWWTRLGLVGLVLGMSWLGAGLWSLWHWLRRTMGHGDEAVLALGVLAAATAGLAHGFIDVGYALPELMLVWVLSFHLCGSCVPK